jgi:hypothetical protein
LSNARHPFAILPACIKAEDSSALEFDQWQFVHFCTNAILKLITTLRLAWEKNSMAQLTILAAVTANTKPKWEIGYRLKNAAMPYLDKT